jgi:chromosome partitioning protein
LLEEARAYNEPLRAWAVLNRADPINKDNVAALGIVNDISGIQILQTRLGNRKAFRAATGQGLIVTEMKPRDGKAAAEITQLFSEIYAMESS